MNLNFIISQPPIPHPEYREQAARLQHYESLERELDDAVLTAATTSGGVWNGGGDDDDGKGGGRGGGGSEVDRAGSALSALGSSVPASLRRRLEQSIGLGRRVNELEKQCAMACDARDAATSKVRPKT